MNEWRFYAEFMQIQTKSCEDGQLNQMSRSRHKIENSSAVVRPTENLKINLSSLSLISITKVKINLNFRHMLWPKCLDFQDVGFVLGSVVSDSCRNARHKTCPNEIQKELSATRYTGHFFVHFWQTYLLTGKFLFRFFCGHVLWRMFHFALFAEKSFRGHFCTWRSQLTSWWFITLIYVSALSI